jgi:hypothetical protein
VVGRDCTEAGSQLHLVGEAIDTNEMQRIIIARQLVERNPV